MTREHFDSQIARLLSQWPNSYGTERTARVWQTFKNIDNSVFTSIVDLAIDSCRSAPLVDDLAALEGRIKERMANDRVYQGLGSLPGSSLLSHMVQLQYTNRTADKDFTKLCVKILRDKLDGRITHEQFLEGCSYLDEVARAFK